MQKNELALPAAAEVRRPFRLWMTGSLAVVMASVCTGRGVLDDERLAGSMRMLRHSPYSVTETVLRIEAAARESGQSVLARVGERGDSGPVIVLASSVGGTPVLMAQADSPPDVPLSVQVRQSADGGADVLVSGSGSIDRLADLEGLPAPVAAELAALPGLLDRALS